MPSTTWVVMGYRAWQALGHQVRHGEQSISILAPCTYKVKAKTVGTSNDEPDSDPIAEAADEAPERGSGAGCCAASVSPTSSTSPRPTATECNLPPGPTSSAATHPPGSGRRSPDRSPLQGFTLNRAEITSGANGVTNFATRTVTVAPHLSAAQAAKTLAHELAHVTMHTGTEYVTGCRGQAEVEAESVAYILCQTAGLTTDATASATSPTGPEATPKPSVQRPTASSPPPAPSLMPQGP